jgi:hypothetical protein
MKQGIYASSSNSFWLKLYELKVKLLLLLFCFFTSAMFRLDCMSSMDTVQVLSMCSWSPVSVRPPGIFLVLQAIVVAEI